LEKAGAWILRLGGGDRWPGRRSYVKVYAMVVKRLKFWLKNCPNCGQSVDAIGFSQKLSFKDTFKETSIICPKCGTELKSVRSPTPVSKYMYNSFFPVSFILLGASVYLHKPYSDLFFYAWGLFAICVIVSIFDAFTLEKK
jgi:hypothetical protein